MLLRSGEITDLKLQPRFRLVVEMEYVADFQYHERTTGRRVVEDVKGFRTREYIRKKRLMLEQHAIEVKEI